MIIMISFVPKFLVLNEEDSFHAAFFLLKHVPDNK